jgi:hypothetical protein
MPDTTLTNDQTKDANEGAGPPSAWIKQRRLLHFIQIKHANILRALADR